MIFAELKKRLHRMQYHESKTKLCIQRKIFGVSNDEKTLSTAVLFNNNPGWFFTCHYFLQVRTIMHFSLKAKTFFFSFPQKNHPFDYAESLSEVLQDRIWQKIDLFFAYPQSKAFVRIVRNNLLLFIFIIIKDSRK